jgi:hypothetical protein
MTIILVPKIPILLPRYHSLGAWKFDHEPIFINSDRGRKQPARLAHATCESVGYGGW